MNADMSEAEDRLSPAAKQALAEILGEHRQKILGAVNDLSPVGEISASDFIHAVGSSENESDHSRLLSSYAKASYEDAGQWRIIGLTASLALLIAGFTAVVPFVTPGVGLDTDVANFLSIGVAAVSVLAAYTITLLTLRQTSRLRARARSLEVQSGTLAPWEELEGRSSASPAQLTGMFLEGWVRAERHLRALSSAPMTDRSARNLPLGALLSSLATSGDLTSEEFTTVRRLLRLRNQIVHGEAIGRVEPQDVDEVNAVADRLAQLEHSRSRPTSI